MAVPTLLFSTSLLKSAAIPRRDCAGTISRKCPEMGGLLVATLVAECEPNSVCKYCTAVPEYH
jgi:hypothetical protein